MKHYTVIITLCSGRTFKSSTVMVLLSISLLIILSFLFLLTNSFGYIEGKPQEQVPRNAIVLASATTTTAKVTKQNIFPNLHIIPDFNYNYKNSSSVSFNSQLGTESKNNNNWITVNHDIYGTRSSNQTIIKKDNVAVLKVKWRLCAGLLLYHHSI